MQSKDEIRQRIQQLTGAIEKHRKDQTNNHARGGYSGAHYSNRPMSFSRTWTNNHNRGSPNKSVIFNGPRNAPATSHSYNKRLVLNKTEASTRPPQPRIPPSSSSSPHKKLVLNNTTTKPPKPTFSATTTTTTTAPGAPKQIEIGGVKFMVKGKKLIRQDRLKNQPLPSGMAAGSHVVVVRRNKRTRPPGSDPGAAKKMRPTTARSRKGNMVFVRGPEGYVRQGASGKSLVLKSKRVTRRYCGHYTRYGKCPQQPRCPFIHDPKRRAICPRFLQNKCPKPANLCRLSHQPTPNIIPHCVHFQRGRCTNTDCIFSHVHVRPDAPVCRAFAMEGYCSKGLECREKHIHVCPEFAETGKCSNANCRLPHVARRAATGGQGTAGIIRPGTWVSTAYWHEQRKLQADSNNKRTANRTLSNIPPPSNSNSSDSNNMTTPRPTREEEEQQGFVRLFDDSEEDEGWSQYLSQDHVQEESSQLHFSDNDEDEDDENSSVGDSDSNMDEDEDEEVDEEDEEVDEYEIAEDDGEYVEEEQVIAK